jgi:disulfide bond formation protein DsbB
MIEAMQNLNYLLALGGIGGILVILFLAYDLKAKQRLSSLVKSWGLIGAFFATLGSSVMTLVYSEYFGITPCGLCWLERIALYPQVLLLGMAYYYKDTLIARYGIGLSIIGLIVSLYHHYIQMGGSEFVKCPTSGGDCAKRFMFEFDFITFPLLAAILFAFLIVLYLYILKTRH